MDFIFCPRHPNARISYLYLSPNKTEILCENCLEDNVIHSEQFKINKLISINTLLQKPEIIFKKLDLDSDLQNTLSRSLNYNSTFIKEQIMEVEKQIKIVQAYIQNILQEFKTCIKNLEKLRKQFLDDIIKGFNFEALKQLLMVLVQSKDNINPDAIGQLKLRLHQYFSSLQKDNAKEANNIICSKIYQISPNVEQQVQKLQNFEQIKQIIEKVQKHQYKLVNSIMPQLPKNIDSTLFSDSQKQYISNLITQRSKKDIAYIRLIYVGSRNGLNGQQFWSRVNGKRNLLMLFKSKSNCIFGAYSPCLWQQNLNNYVQDSSNTSFLFSQTRNEIYPIREDQNKYAIYCDSNSGPIFGIQDLQINTDFQGGQSKLGNGYHSNFQNLYYSHSQPALSPQPHGFSQTLNRMSQSKISTSKIQTQTTSRVQLQFQNSGHLYLFGQEHPHIIECEIFEILFK